MIFNRIPKYQRGQDLGTTQADVIRLLCDDAEQAPLEKRVKRTMSLMKALVQTDPVEAAHTLISGDPGCGDAVMGYYLTLSLYHWITPLYQALSEHPFIAEMERERIAKRERADALATTAATEDPARIHERATTD